MSTKFIKPYRTDGLREFLKLPKDSKSPKLDNKLKAMVAFIEKFQTIENTFSFIIDFTSMQYLFVSESIAHITGHTNWEEGGVEFAMSLYHPDDEQAAKKIHEKKIDHIYSVPIKERGNYRQTHDFRIRHANGHYIRINHHAVYLQFDELGHPLSCLCICNNITQLKKSTTLNFEVAELDESGAYLPILKEYYPISKAIEISSREYEVLCLLSEGSTNKQIADKTSKLAIAGSIVSHGPTQEIKDKFIGPRFF